MIEVVKIKKKYKRNIVLKDISIVFPDKGLVTIVGKSGSGKSTLLNIISGLEAANSGTIIIDDMIFKKYKDNKLSKMRSEKIGVIFQNYNLFLEKTVSENINFVLENYKKEDEETKKVIIARALDMVGLKDYELRVVNQLSGGQQQRVAIARAIALDPNYYVADEPTGNLDPLNTIQVMNTLKEISKEKLVIMVTHDLKNYLRYSDYIYDMSTKELLKNDKKNKRKIAVQDVIYLDKLNNIESSNGIKIYTDETKKIENMEFILYNNSLYVNSKKNENVILYDSFGQIKIQDKKSKIEVKVDAKNDYALNKYKLSDYIYHQKSIMDKIVFTMIGILLAMFSLLLISGTVASKSVKMISKNVYQHNFYDKRTMNHIVESVGDSGIFFENHSLIKGIYINNLGRKIALKDEKIARSILSKKPIHLLKEDSIILGNVPSIINGIVLSSGFYLSNVAGFKEIGINSMNDLIGIGIEMYGKNFLIQGVTNEYTIYTYVDNDYYNSYYDTSDNTMIMNHRLITKMGRKIAIPRSKAVAISSLLAETYRVSVGDMITFYDEKWIVETIFSYQDKCVIFNEIEYLDFQYEKLYLESLMLYITEGMRFGRNLYDTAFLKQKTQYSQNSVLFYTLSIIMILIAIAVFIILMIINNSRNIYNISVVRSLGTTKKRVTKTYFIKDFFSSIIFSWAGLLLGFIFIYIFVEQNGDKMYIGFDYKMSISAIGIWAVTLSMFSYILIKRISKKRPATLARKGSI